MIRVNKKAMFYQTFRIGLLPYLHQEVLTMTLSVSWKKHFNSIVGYFMCSFKHSKVFRKAISYLWASRWTKYTQIHPVMLSKRTMSKVGLWCIYKKAVAKTAELLKKLHLAHTITSFLFCKLRFVNGLKPWRQQQSQWNNKRKIGRNGPVRNNFLSEREKVLPTFSVIGTYPTS